MNKYFQLLTFILLLTTIGCFAHCSHKKRMINSQEKVSKINMSKDALFKDTEIISIGIYCWCFSLFPYDYIQEGKDLLIKDYLKREVTDINICLTPTNLHNEDIVKDNYLRERFEDDDIIAIFQDSFLNGFHKIRQHDLGSDPRLIFEIKFRGRPNSYLTYCSKNTMILDDSLFIEYPYRIDSVLLNLESQFDFICPSD